MIRNAHSVLKSAFVLLALIASACSSVPSATSDKDVTYAEKDLGGTPLSNGVWPA